MIVIIKILIVLFIIIFIHVLCGVLCMYHMSNSSRSFDIIDFLLLSILGPLMVAIWLIGDLYCWFITKINKKHEYRGIKK
jgi:hypothetical protein